MRIFRAVNWIELILPVTVCTEVIVQNSIKVLTLRASRVVHSLRYQGLAVA